MRPPPPFSSTPASATYIICVWFGTTGLGEMRHIAEGGGMDTPGPHRRCFALEGRNSSSTKQKRCTYDNCTTAYPPPSVLRRQAKLNDELRTDPSPIHPSNPPILQPPTPRRNSTRFYVESHKQPKHFFSSNDHLLFVFFSSRDYILTAG